LTGETKYDFEQLFFIPGSRITIKVQWRRTFVQLILYSSFFEPRRTQCHGVSQGAYVLLCVLRASVVQLIIKEQKVQVCDATDDH
jgi:hypothetical protein